MKEEEDNNIYSLPEEEEENDSYILPDEDPDEDTDPDDGDEPGKYPDPVGPRRKEAGRWYPLSLMFKVLFNPVEGWKALNRHKSLTPEVMARRCFFPMAALAAVSAFSVFIYGFDPSVEQAVVKATVSFITFFLGYYSILFCGRILLGPEVGSRLDDRYGRGLVMLSLSTLALFSSINRWMPMLEPVLVFLPLWTIYTVTRGVKYLRAPAGRATRVTVIVVALIIGMPLVINWIFGKIL